MHAFEVLIRRHLPLMRAYARRQLQASDEVDDVVQETFISAWQTLDRLQEPGKVKSWLMRILSRRCIDQVTATILYDHPIHDAVALVGDAITDALRHHTDLNLAAVDVTIRDVRLPTSERPHD